MTLTTTGLGLCVPDRDRGPRWLVRDLDLRVEDGEVLVVVGRNGSGKTTLLRTLAGVRRPDAGTIALADRDLSTIDPRARARAIAYLPQSTPLYHDLTVAELVALGRAPHQSRLRAPGPADATAVADALARVDASDLAHRSLATLSGGERQRVMIARMLATGARTLVMDEPTAALDIAHVLALLELVRSLAASEHAIVHALHDLDLARRHADRALILGAGDDGEHCLGPSAQVLTPEKLSPIFGVTITEHPHGLSFTPGRATSPVQSRP